MSHREIDVDEKGSILVDKWLYIRFFGNVSLSEVLSFVEESQHIRVQLSCFIDHRLASLPTTHAATMQPSDVKQFCESLKLPGESGSVKLPGESESVKLPGESGSVKLPGESESVKLPGESGSVKLPGESGSVKLSEENTPVKLPTETTPMKLPEEVKRAMRTVKESYEDCEASRVIENLTDFLKKTLPYSVEDVSASKAKALFVDMGDGCEEIGTNSVM